MGEKIEMGLSTLYCDGKQVGIGKIKTSGLNVKAEKPIPAREWKPKNLSAEFTLNIEDNEQVRKFAKMLADDAAKAVKEYNQKVALACEYICRNYVTPPIKGEITRGKLRWRGISGSVYQQTDDGMCWLGLVQRDMLITLDGRRFPIENGKVMSK